MIFLNILWVCNLKSKKRNFKALEERRLRAVYLFKKGVKQAEIAHRLGVTRQAVHIWYKKYQKVVSGPCWQQKRRVVRQNCAFQLLSKNSQRY